jgi:hypothetical protein
VVMFALNAAGVDELNLVAFLGSGVAAALLVVVLLKTITSMRRGSDRG